MNVPTEVYIPTVLRMRGGKVIKRQALCMNKDWTYYPADQTDVQRTWAAHGWTPPKGNHPRVN